MLGLLVPIPTFPLLSILIASVPPLFPVWKMMSAPVAPTPEVDLKVRGEVVPVPPITKGSVIPVVKVGDVPNTATPVPVSSERIPASSEEVAAPAEVVSWLDPLVATKEDTPRPERVTVPEEVIPVAPVIAPAEEITIEGVFKKLVYPVAERKFIPLVVSDPPRTPPASKLSRFRALVPDKGVEVLVGVISNPPTVIPALAVLVFWNAKDCPLPPDDPLCA